MLAALLALAGCGGTPGPPEVRLVDARSADALAELPPAPDLIVRAGSLRLDSARALAALRPGWPDAPQTPAALELHPPYTDESSLRIASLSDAAATHRQAFALAPDGAGAIVLWIEPDVPVATVVAVLYTLGQAGFDRIELAFSAPSPRVVRLDLGYGAPRAPCAQPVWSVDASGGVLSLLRQNPLDAFTTDDGGPRAVSVDLGVGRCPDLATGDDPAPLTRALTALDGRRCPMTLVQPALDAPWRALAPWLEALRVASPQGALSLALPADGDSLAARCASPRVNLDAARATAAAWTRLQPRSEGSLEELIDALGGR